MYIYIYIYICLHSPGGGEARPPRDPRPGAAPEARIF